MKKISKLFRSFGILLLLIYTNMFSCNSDVGTKAEINKENVEEIVINKEDSNFDINSLVKIKKVIPLESSDECTIDKIQRLIIYNDKIVIFDRKGISILCFDESGKFISRIGRPGKGPGEYIDARDISIYGDNLYVLGFRKVHIYDLKSFEFVKTILIDFDGNTLYNPVRIAVVGDANIYFWAQSPDTYEEDVEFFNLINYNNGDYNYFYPRRALDIGGQVFSKVADGKGHYCVLPMDDTRVLKLTNEKEPFSQYEFIVPKPMPKDFAMTTNKREINNLIKSPYQKMMILFFETSDHIIFRYVGEGGSYSEGLFIRQEQIAYTGKRKSNFPVVEFSDSDYFYGTMQSYKILEFLENSNIGPFVDKAKNLNLSELDNPVVFIFSID